MITLNQIALGFFGTILEQAKTKALVKIQIKYPSIVLIKSVKEYIFQDILHAEIKIGETLHPIPATIIKEYESMVADLVYETIEKIIEDEK